MWLVLEKCRKTGCIRIVFSGNFSEVMDSMAKNIKPGDINFSYCAVKVEVGQNWS